MMDYAGRVAQADTYPKLLRLNAREHGGDIALREKDFGLWRVFTWNHYQTRVHDFALGLVELGLGRGDVIGIIGDNRPDWVSAEIATHAIGAMSLGLYRDVLDEEAAYLLSYGEAKLVFAEDEEQVDKLLTLAERVPNLKHIVYSDPRGMRKYDDPRLMEADKLAALGRDRAARDPVTVTTTAKVIYRAYQLGAVFFYVGLRGNVLELTPPLTLSEAEAEEGVALVDRALTDVSNGLVSDADVAPYMMW